MLLINPPNKFFSYACEKKSHHSHILLFFSVISLVLISPKSYAEASYICPVNNRATSNYTTPRSFSKSNIDNTDISADFTETSSDNTTSLDGDVVIEQDKLRIVADHADYNSEDNIIHFSGDVHIDTETIALDADEGEINIGTANTEDGNTGTFKNTTFFLPDSNMKGQAKKIISSERIEGLPDKPKNTVLYNASITSCNLIDPDWLLTADEINLDHDDESGSADHAVLRFKGVPFLYTPYIKFPTSDKRRSGFLFPTLGSSSVSGTELSTPWYWNIAPNQDAVITPHYMAKRGLEVGGDYRYLTRSTTGNLKGTYLNNDSLRNDDNRYMVQYQQHSRILPNLVFDTNIIDVSDSDYFNDFSNSLSSASQTHLNRSATLNYNLSNWRINALVQDIKTIDPTIAKLNRPYERLPQLTLSGGTAIAQSDFRFTMDSEYVDFDHKSATKITGSRITVRPGLQLPLRGTAWFLTPAVKFSHTQYNVGTDGNSTTPGTNVSVGDRNLFTSSLDAGLFFERPLSNGYRQTLEPRLFYLNVPFTKQTDIPLFDTSNPDFTVAQLFRDNRFVGGDRIGDTNQLTMALTSRILNPDTGTEFLRASIGQILYFKDRKVALTGNTVDTRNSSDIVAALNGKWQRWQGDVNLQWDTQNQKLSQDSFVLHYRSSARNLFNMGYRKRINTKTNNVDLEQIDTSFVYAINKNYTGIARWNYSLQDSKGLDTIAGITYDSCCWSIQLLGQRRVLNTSTSANTESAYDNSILLQFVLKGLGSLSGSRTRTTLEQSIYGYTDVYQ